MHTSSHHFDIAALSVAEKIKLAEQLWESVREEIAGAPLTPEQTAEVKRRITAIESGSVICEPFDLVMRQLRGR